MDYAAHTQAGGIPTAGQVVRLGAEANPQFAARPITLQLTEDAQPSALEASAGRTLADAEWLRLSGWELDDAGLRAIERVVSARRAGITIVHHSPTVQP